MIIRAQAFQIFVRFCPHTYAHIQLSLPPLWAAIVSFNDRECLPDYKNLNYN